MLTKILVFLFAGKDLSDFELWLHNELVVLDDQVSWLGVVISPGGEVVVALGGAAVGLDFDPANLSKV
jgi:hypothetical protein